MVKELTWKSGSEEIKFKFKEPETMEEYLEWEVPMEGTDNLWKKSNKIEMGMINSMMIEGPKLTAKTNPKCFKYLQKNLRDFLE